MMMSSKSVKKGSDDGGEREVNLGIVSRMRKIRIRERKEGGGG